MVVGSLFCAITMAYSLP